MSGRKTPCAAAAGLVALMLLASDASADGAFIWNKGADLYEPSQKAILLHQKDVEDLILQVKYSGPARDFCWIVPLPSVPEISAVKRDVFSEISLYTQLRWKWGYRKAGEPKVEVIARKKVGVYDTVVLKGSDPGELQRWLVKAGYAFPASGKHLLAHYARRKWVFVALRIHPQELTSVVAAKLHEGTIQPVLFTFKSTPIVYPLYNSSMNAGETEVLLYVLADHPVAHPWFHTDNHPRWAMRGTSFLEHESMVRFVDKWGKGYYYRRVTEKELPACRAVLKRMSDSRFFLTRLRGRFCSQLMSDDVVILPSPRLKAQLTQRKHFAARLMIERYIATTGYRCFSKLPNRDRYRIADAVIHRVGLEAGINEVQSEILKETGEAHRAGIVRLPPGWFQKLDKREGVHLLRSALMFHRRMVEARAAVRDRTKATAQLQEGEQFAMTICCRVLARPVPQYKSWEQFQKHWPEIESAVSEREMKTPATNRASNFPVIAWLPGPVLVLAGLGLLAFFAYRKNKRQPE